ncbi:MAG TPA: response regulator transcription factor [Dehalococcoidia bacterium]|nr:response regulator transcription factor [Dehalococcoidia bacterium]
MGSARKILVVDDDPKTVSLVKLYLESDGHKVLCAYDGVEALRLAREERPNLIVLDLMLPGMDGLQVCRTLRTESDVPVIMLTAKTTEGDKLTGLELGADDYVTKPFSPRELAARIKVVLRRTVSESLERGPEQAAYGDLKMDFRQHTVSIAGRPVALTPTEFRLLGTLVREAGQVLSREQLIQRVLGLDFDGFDRTIDVHVLNLRRKLGDDPARPRYIKTVYGAGYKFEASDK